MLKKTQDSLDVSQRASCAAYHLSITISASAGFQRGGDAVHLKEETWNTIQQAYVDREALQTARLAYGAISGVVDAMGDTGPICFPTPDMVQEQPNFTRGQFGGTGVEVQVKDGNVVIVAPMGDSPAQQAGLHPGDVILKVNGEDVAGLPLDKNILLEKDVHGQANSDNSAARRLGDRAANGGID